jgi:NifU-like protein involved in Fe-S cluster formation
MWDYTEKVKEFFLHPKNAGEIENPLHGERRSEGDHTQIEQRHSHARMQHVNDNVDEQATIPVQVEDK